MDEPCYYGFPVYGEQAVKVARDLGGEEVSVETRTFETNQATLDGTREFIRKHLPEAVAPEARPGTVAPEARPGTVGQLYRNKTCLYTLTPDRDFVVDRVPGHNQILVLIGAGHAFKFASALGRIASELVVTGETSSALEPFSLSRPILHESNPAKSFMM